VAQEHIGQVRPSPNALDPSMRLLNDLGQGRTGEVANSTLLRLNHRLAGFSSVRTERQLFDHRRDRWQFSQARVAQLGLSAATVHP
jgi:hypothetical protein